MVPVIVSPGGQARRAELARAAVADSRVELVHRKRHGFAGLHFPLLLLSAFLPYAAITMGRYPGNPAAALLFGLVVAALLVCRSGIRTVTGHGGLMLPDVDRRQFAASTVGNWIGTAYWIVTLPLVWWAPWVQIPWFLAILVDLAALHAVGRLAARGR
jgi:hypothetical protein